MMWQTNIKVQYSLYSDTQRKAVDYLLLNNDTVKNMTLRQCAAASCAGQPTILRMLEKAGYEGWSDFIRQVWSETDTETGSHKKFTTKKDTTKDAVIQIIRDDLQMIADMAKELDMKQLDKVVRIIKKAKVIDVYGTDNSANAASELSGRLLHLGLTSRNYSDLFFQKISAGHLGERDVAISFSISGETTAVIDALLAAQKCGAVTIAVTGDRESQLARAADYVFTTPTIYFSEVSRWNSSRISQIAFVDALCVALMESDRERFSAMLTRSTKEFEEDISERAKRQN